MSKYRPHALLLLSLAAGSACSAERPSESPDEELQLAGANSGNAGRGSDSAGSNGNARGGTSAVGAAGAMGGFDASGGSASVAGSTSGGSASSGSASGGVGPVQPAGPCVPATCGSHKWACFPMPNPAGSGLPNQAKYTDLGNGVVRDDLTCLEWEKAPVTVAADTASWDGALAYCDELALGGSTDWRVPTRVELASIVDFSKSPAINGSAFPSAKGGYHRTSSDWILDIKQIGAGAGKDFAWIYNMSVGLTSNAYSRASAAEVRCVRGNGAGEEPTSAAVAPPNQYTAIAGGEVQDNYTGLVWQAGSSDAPMEFTAAPAYCAALGLNGHTFRVPTMTELTSLVDEAQVAPAINRTLFPDTKSGKGIYYWSSQAYVKNSAQGWGLNFDDGFTGYDSGAAGTWNSFPTAWVRCVR
jgi:hypothetical protein